MIAPPSPVDTQTIDDDLKRHETMRSPRGPSPFDSYAAVGQLSYAPATKTTVVTTTTTTTTSFPPILFKNPRNLLERDPKQYPLAATPTPQSIRKLCFDLGGIQTRFEEDEDVRGNVLEVSLTPKMKIRGLAALSTSNTSPVFAFVSLY